MAWIAFDQDTNEALREAGLRGKVRIGSGEPLARALGEDSSSVLLLPNQAENVFLLTILRPEKPEVAAAHTTAPGERHQVNYVSGGFLGLTDEVEFEPEAEDQKRWWKKLWR